MRLIDADTLVNVVKTARKKARTLTGMDFVMITEDQPTIAAIPVEWLNERHRKCCEEGDTDLMDAITVLCNEYHVWQKEQEAQDE